MGISRKTFLISVAFFAIFSCAFILDAHASSDASLFFDTTQKIFNTGDEAVVSVRVESPNQNINAVTGSFKLPKNFRLESIEDTGGILDFWVMEPKAVNNVISFEGVAIKKPYRGDNGLVFSMRGIVTTPGTLSFRFDDGVILADDGLGTNILGSLRSLSIIIKDAVKPPDIATLDVQVDTTNGQIMTPAPILTPFITSKILPINPSESFTIEGKGTPNALTKIDFQDVTAPSVGVSLIRFLVKGRVPLSNVEVKNDANGVFSYMSPNNLVAGVYNAVPEYVNSDKTKGVIGTGIKLFIQEDTINKILIIIINVLVLVVPIMTLILIIIFLPWYFIRRLHIMRKQMEFEEQKIDIEERHLVEKKTPRL